jgi:hypothetical protein
MHLSISRAHGRRRHTELELPLRAVALAPPEPASLELFVRRDPPASPLAALSLVLTQPTAPDLWFSPGPQDSGKERLI